MNITKILTILSILFFSSAHAQSIRGVNGTIEEAHFILTTNTITDDAASRKLVFIRSCDSCSDKLTITNNTEVVTTINQIKTSAYLKNNTTYFAGMISYNKNTNVVLSIVLSANN
jgi:hypothetical protein